MSRFKIAEFNNFDQFITSLLFEIIPTTIIKYIITPYIIGNPIYNKCLEEFKWIQYYGNHFLLPSHYYCTSMMNQ